MSLVNNTTEILLNPQNINYYENLGYTIPRKENKYKKITVSKGTKINVNINDLPKGSFAKILVSCDNCKKIYTIEYRTYTRCLREGNYYCRPCGSKLFNSGENNSQWNNLLTDEEREIQRNTLENKEFIKKVLARDHYTCQCCGQEHGDLNAHHLDGWNNYKDKRYDETNGITLCETCHKNFHSLYGYGENTKEQFEEWIGQAIELVKYKGELPTARKIYCMEEDKIYDSIKELCELWKCNSSSVYKTCNPNYSNTMINGKHLKYI